MGGFERLKRTIRTTDGGMLRRRYRVCDGPNCCGRSLPAAAFGRHESKHCMVCSAMIERRKLREMEKQLSEKIETLTRSIMKIVEREEEYEARMRAAAGEGES